MRFAGCLDTERFVLATRLVITALCKKPGPLIRDAQRTPLAWKLRGPKPRDGKHPSDPIVSPFAENVRHLLRIGDNRCPNSDMSSSDQRETAPHFMSVRSESISDDTTFALHR
jgi:hypothetical protein